MRAFDLDASYFSRLLDDQPLGGAGTITTLRLSFHPQQENPRPVSVSADDQQVLSSEEHCHGSIFILYSTKIKLSDYS